MTSWFYKPSLRLLALAKSAIRSYVADEITVEGVRYRPAVFTGVVTPSDFFGVSDAKIADMREKLQPDIMEMESAAIAQVCRHLGGPIRLVDVKRRAVDSRSSRRAAVRCR